MTDFLHLITNLRRPRMLVRAARHGLQDYRRDRDLRRLVDPAVMHAPQRTLAGLVEEEELAEDARLRGDATYSIARHIELLIALMAEVQLLPHQRPGT